MRNYVGVFDGIGTCNLILANSPALVTRIVALVDLQRHIISASGSSLTEHLLKVNEVESRIDLKISFSCVDPIDILLLGQAFSFVAIRLQVVNEVEETLRHGAL